MTYNEIIRQALNHLEYRTDDEAMSEVFERFIMYANDATRIIANSLKMTGTVDVIISEGEQPSFDVGSIELQLESSGKRLTKICDVWDKETKRPYKFFSGNEYGEFVVAAKPGTDITVRYRYMPVDTTDGDAEPGIPAIFHPIMYLYVVHCFHNTRSSSTNYDQQKWLYEFERQRKILTREYGASNAYSWKNLPWHTGEI